MPPSSANSYVVFGRDTDWHELLRTKLDSKNAMLTSDKCPNNSDYNVKRFNGNSVKTSFRRSTRPGIPTKLAEAMRLTRMAGACRYRAKKKNETDDWFAAVHLQNRSS